MSNFEDNPFGDPTIDNPFADPSIQQATQKTNVPPPPGLDDYNPFEDQNAKRSIVGGAVPFSEPATVPAQQPTQPAIMQGVSPPASSQYSRSQPQQQSQAPPSNFTTADFQKPLPASSQYSRSQPQQQSQAPPSNFTTADFQRRQEELERKAEELARREAELRAGSAGRRNNWPPLPAFCPVQPCFYQDINVDIPLEFQRIVRYLYHLWMFHALILTVNMIGTLALLCVGAGFTPFGLSILYFILLTPFSFICWYRPIYKAFRSDSSFNFMVFFFIFLFQIVISVIQSIGIPGGGFCGLYTSIQIFSTSIGAGLVCILIAIAFIVATVADILLMTKVHRIYRSTGASLAKAQAEFTTEILRNQHVQTAASSAAAAAVNAQIANATGAGGNRY